VAIRKYGAGEIIESTQEPDREDEEREEPGSSEDATEGSDDQD
jgi:hypothetical protein